ncbi:MAG: phospholipid/cholesterol/gamma-HCH transport system permease protein [Verrucomicrobia bacterium]|nr:MAG: phospholipid/cholesterol/gamma-HCH transport system permease protein [Verrucomicrobiota bacterium]
MVETIFKGVGSTVIRLLRYVGQLAFLVGETATSIRVAPLRWALFFKQVAEIGFGSQLVVVVTGAFTGAVFSAQTFFQFHRLGMDSAVGAVVAVSMFRELGPVLTALMLSGRVGASIAAEIGTMKVTEQIEALRSLGVHPIDYLIVPRILALLVSTPLLVAECVGLGIGAGYLVATKVLGVSKAYYLTNMLSFTTGRDIKMALIKGMVFAGLIGFIACEEGLKTANGAAGVGRAPTQAVVIASLVILISNFFLSFLLNIFFPAGAY